MLYSGDTKLSQLKPTYEVHVLALCHLEFVHWFISDPFILFLKPKRHRVKIYF